ncbi:MAG: undecaprenyldiphospho-muramoylpentapeptide beta-N-acetylglucosaminyltransferase [Verrucomicrobiales bacterium]|nr:undecaprenyldiphospho-muramoylpentapeptide beta-N-acetylglucosaminyltransferase [Verrucomicrobiales bacterium]
MKPDSGVRRVAIACGGTGGHVFPGLAVAHALAARGIEVVLFVSPKDIDRRSLHGRAAGFRVECLPMVGLTRGNLPLFLRALWRGYRVSLGIFSEWLPDAVLGMGGFTSAGPILAGWRRGAFCCFHESNAVPGRANRWLARLADAGFVGFSSTAGRFPVRRIWVTGTPVRTEFRTANREAACAALGLDPVRPVLLVMGGSQGARGVNQLVVAAVPGLADRFPTLQFCHLTGVSDQEAVRTAYASAGVPALVQPFSDRMDQLMTAATVAVSRSGASSLAELAAVRLPAVLIPYPDATDDHQRLNAEVFASAGAARILDQVTAGPGDLVSALTDLLADPHLRDSMRDALSELDAPDAAERIADGIERRGHSAGEGPERKPRPPAADGRAGRTVARRHLEEVS